MIIDPGDDIEDILAIVRENKLKVKQIVITTPTSTTSAER